MIVGTRDKNPFFSMNTLMMTMATTNNNTSTPSMDLGSHEAPISINPYIFNNSSENGPSNLAQCIPFPFKLYDLLEESEKEGHGAIISWMPNGSSSFKIYNQREFVQTLMRRYFKQSHYKSFQRQLNNWGFERIQCGPEKGAYRHQSFVRGSPHLCQHIKRRTCPSEQRKKLETRKAREVSQSINVFPAQSSSMPTPLSTCVPRIVSSERNVDQSFAFKQRMAAMSSANALWSSLIPPINMVQSNFTEDIAPIDIFNRPNSCMDASVRDGECLDFAGKNFFYVADEEEENPTLMHNHLMQAPVSSPMGQRRTVSVENASFDTLIDMF